MTDPTLTPERLEQMGDPNFGLLTLTTQELSALIAAARERDALRAERHTERNQVMEYHAAMQRELGASRARLDAVEAERDALQAKLAEYEDGNPATDSPRRSGLYLIRHAHPGDYSITHWSTCTYLWQIELDDNDRWYSIPGGCGDD